MISYGARIVCILVGAALAAAVFIARPPSNVVELAAFEVDYDTDYQDKRRDSAQRAIMSALQKNANGCDSEQRAAARRAVALYFRVRAEAIATAERFLAPADTEKVRSSWDEGAGKAVWETVGAAAAAGLFSRTDFRPGAPELLSLLDAIPTATPGCTEAPG